MEAEFKTVWDYSEWRVRYGNEVYTDLECGVTQKDWNQTLVTKINYLSAQIFQANERCGANKISVHPKIFSILMTLEFLKLNDDGVFMLSGKYAVDINNLLPTDKLYVYHGPITPESLVGEIKIKNL